MAKKYGLPQGKQVEKLKKVPYNRELYNHVDISLDR
jgi:hypothetical protein